MWVSFNYGQTPKENDSRGYLTEIGIMSLQVMAKKCNGRRIACGAFVTGTGSCVLYMSTEFRGIEIDLVTTNERLGRIWNDDRGKLKELGFVMEESRAITKLEMKTLHRHYLAQFLRLPIVRVTAFPNDKEWHIARRLCISSNYCWSVHCWRRQRSLTPKSQHSKMEFEHGVIATGRGPGDEGLIGEVMMNTTV